MSRILLPVVLMLALAGLFTAGQAQIADTSHHNFSSSGTYAFSNVVGFARGTSTEICVYCHTPHRTVAAELLWNRNNPSASNFALYTPLSGNTGALGDASLRCLSCHDGVTGINSLVKSPSTGTLTTGTIDTSAIPAGWNLTNDHPVGFTVPLTGPTTGWVTTPGSGGFAKVYSGKVECASCHDPHTAAQAKFLRAANTASQICKDCHYK